MYVNLIIILVTLLENKGSSPKLLKIQEKETYIPAKVICTFGLNIITATYHNKFHTIHIARSWTPFGLQTKPIY